MLVGTEVMGGFIPKEYPYPLGLISDIRDLIAECSIMDQPGLAMIGAVSIASVLVANRYKVGSTWSNLYTLAVAPTGSGKSFPINTALRLLAVDKDTGLFGKEQVLSGQALIKGLESQRERLDVVDECSNLFNMITRGGVFQADILATLLKLYTQSSSLFIGPETKGQDPIRVFHPCVSTMMLTNKEDLIMSVTKNFISGGLLPRFLTFVEWDYGKKNRNPRWNEELAKKVLHGIEIITGVPIEMEEGKNRNLLCPRPMPREARISDSARTILKEYGDDCQTEIMDPSTEETRRYFLSRAAQNAEKLALIHGILSHGSIETGDALWGIDMVNVCMHNSMPLYTQICARNAIEAGVIGVLEVIRKYGTITLSDLYRETRHLSKMQRNEAIDALKIEGSIRAIKSQTGLEFEALI